MKHLLAFILVLGMFPFLLGCGDPELPPEGEPIPLDGEDDETPPEPDE